MFTLRNNVIDWMRQGVEKHMSHLIIGRHITRDVQYPVYTEQHEDVWEKEQFLPNVEAVYELPQDIPTSEFNPEKHAKQVSRRNFLRMVGTAGIVIAAAPVLDALDALPASTKTVLTSYEQREAVLAAALDSVEGRTALAQAMVEPIKQSLMYQGIGRKLLMVDELPQGAIARYERDIAIRSFDIPKRDNISDDTLLIPHLELAAVPHIQYEEVRPRRYCVVDRAVVVQKDLLQRQEDADLFKCMKIRLKG